YDAFVHTGCRPAVRAARAAHVPVVVDDAAGPRCQSEWWRLSAALSAGTMSLAQVAITDPDGGWQWVSRVAVLLTGG
ncbi:MAG TPA: hypothetical protein VIW27_10735, partial [Gammaproteobacteria bacterium]